MGPLQVLNLKKEEEDKRKLEMEVEMLQHEFERRHGDGTKLEDGHPKPSGSGQPQGNTNICQYFPVLKNLQRIGMSPEYQQSLQ